jgi:hypothetical protein
LNNDFYWPLKSEKAAIDKIGIIFKLMKYYETETLDFVDANGYVVHHERL